MEYRVTTGSPITEHEALEQVAAMGFHGLAFDDAQDQDETLHWHEFDAVDIAGGNRGPVLWVSAVCLCLRRFNEQR